MKAAKSAAAANVNKRPLSMRIRSNWQLYLFLILPLAYLLIFCYYPMTGLQLAFKKFQANLGIWGSPWIGFDNFEKFFSSYMFGRVLKNTLVLSIYSLIAGFPLPIILALILNSLRSEKYKKFAQTVTYLPYFISVVVLVGILNQVLNPRIGLVANLLSLVGYHDMPNLIGSPGAFPHLYVWSGVWQSMGYNSIIYIAALASTDPELHEAAQIDGASRFQRLWHITLPGISSTVIMMLIINVGNIMSVGYEKVILMYMPLTYETADVIQSYVYRRGLVDMQYSFATAVGLFNSVVNLILILIVNAISRKVTEVGLW